MTAIEPRPAAALAEIPTAELRSRLARAMRATAESLLELAGVWVELERRGEDLRDLRVGLAKWLPQIAAGTVRPELVIELSGRPQILKLLGSMPMTEQNRIASGTAVPVHVPGESEPVSVPLDRLTTRQVRQVFSDAGIRSPAEQRAFIAQERTKRITKKPVRSATVSFDAATSTLRVGAYHLPLVEVLRVLSAAAGVDRAIPADAEKTSYQVVRVRLWQEEHDAILKHAKSAELPDWALGRMALRAFGLTAGSTDL